MALALVVMTVIKKMHCKSQIDIDRERESDREKDYDSKSDSDNDNRGDDSLKNSCYKK